MAHGGPKKSEASETGPAGPFERLWPPGLVAAVCLAQLAAYAFELRIGAPAFNDHVLHHGLARRVAEAMAGEGSPLDPFIHYWGQGFPVLRYYQPLAHLLVAAAHRLLGGAVSLRDVLLGLHLLMLAAAPAAFYWGGRLLGLSRAAAALSGLCWTLLAVQPGVRHYLGLQVRTFLWNGPGLYTQELALCLLPPAVGACHRAITTGRGLALSLALMSALWWSHLLLGYLACLLLTLSLLAPRRDRSSPRAAALGARARRGALLAGGLSLTTAALTLPVLLEGQWLTRSVMEEPVYWDSFGARHVLKAFFTGALLDGERLPVLTAAACVGAVVAAARGFGESGPWRRRAAARFVLLALIASLLLYFGRPTWGGLLSLLPMADRLPLHRAIVLVHYAALLCAGLALSELIDRLPVVDPRARTAAGLVAAALLLWPAASETWQRREALHREETATAEALARRGEDLVAALRALRGRFGERFARAYAGAAWDWGDRLRIGNAPVYGFWASTGMPSLSYLYHTMGHGSEIEGAFDWRRRDHYALYGVGYALLPTRRHLRDFMQPVLRRPGFIAATVDAGGMFELVGVDRRVGFDPDAQEGLLRFKHQYVLSDWHAARRAVQIDLQPGGTRRGPELEPTGDDWSPPRGRVLRSKAGADRFFAEVELEDPAHLRVRVTMHPGFEVRVDGEPAEAVMLAPAHLGVPLSPGRHRVQVRYRPSPLKAPLATLSVALLAGGFWWERKRSRRDRGDAGDDAVR